MERKFYNVDSPREKEVIGDYWELIAMEQSNDNHMKREKKRIKKAGLFVETERLQVEKLRKDYEDRLGCSNEYFYKNIVITEKDKVKQFSKVLKLKQYGWNLYETVDLKEPYETIICKMMKVISVGYQVTLEDEMSVDVKAACSHIERPTPTNNLDHIEFTAKLHDGEIFSSKEERKDIDLMNHVVKVAEKRVRDRLTGKKVYDEWELLGKEQCSIGAFSFTTRHCTQAVYKKGVCFYHWIQMQDKRAGCNPALPDESLHTYKKPYIPVLDKVAIFSKMRQYAEATRPITPAAETPKKPRCKHLLHKDECSICLGRPSVSSDSIEGLPVEVDNFMVIDY